MTSQPEWQAGDDIGSFMYIIYIYNQKRTTTTCSRLASTVNQTKRDVRPMGTENPSEELHSTEYGRPNQRSL